MNYIVFDLEFNQDFPSMQNIDIKTTRYPYEIIQIGAVRLDSELNQTGEFNRFVKPVIYKNINPFITELTGITTEMLQKEDPFENVYKAYINFIDGNDCVFCVWGMSDIKELYRNAVYHNLGKDLPIKNFINIQPYVSKFLKLSSKKQLGLQNAVEALEIPITSGFHNAFYDAYYTSEIFRKVYNTSMSPGVYDPSYVRPRQKSVRKDVDYDRLLQQFEKMYERKMSDEEQEIIKLAYKMGRTNQFVKP